MLRSRDRNGTPHNALNQRPPERESSVASITRGRGTPSQLLGNLRRGVSPSAEMRFRWLNGASARMSVAGAPMDCRLAAELTDNPSNRADYLALAHQWETRARQIEQPDPRDRLQD
jgi:hypothetical protein